MEEIIEEEPKKNKQTNYPEGSKFYIISEKIIEEIDEKEYKEKRYGDDYKYFSPDSRINVINTDMRNIRPYAMELLNSMNELSFVRMQKWLLFMMLFVMVLVIFTIAKNNGSDATIKALKPSIDQISTTLQYSKIEIQPIAQTGSTIKNVKLK